MPPSSSSSVDAVRMPVLWPEVADSACSGTSPTRNTIAVMLSSPPPCSAARTRFRAIVAAGSSAASRSAMVCSATIVFRPSLHRSTTSPSAATTVNVSTSTESSVPSARVITLRWGWCSASSLAQLALAHQLADERVVVG